MGGLSLSSSYASAATQLHGQGLGPGQASGPGLGPRPNDPNYFVLSSLPLHPHQLAKAEEDVHRFYSTTSTSTTAQETGTSIRHHGNQSNHGNQNNFGNHGYLGNHQGNHGNRGNQEGSFIDTVHSQSQSLSLSSSVAISAVIIGVPTAQGIEEAILKVRVKEYVCVYGGVGV